MNKWRLYISHVRKTFSDKRTKWIVVLATIVYMIFYFAITGLVAVYSLSGPFEIFISDNWPNLIFRERAPFNWEPIGYITVGQVEIFLAVPNIIFGLIIAILVGLNLGASAYTYLNRTVCKVDPTKSVLAAVPALLTGVACCGPSILLSLGIASAAVTVAFISILPLLFPIALVGLIGSLLWSGKKLAEAYG